MQSVRLPWVGDSPVSLVFEICDKISSATMPCDSSLETKMSTVAGCCCCYSFGVSNLKLNWARHGARDSKKHCISVSELVESMVKIPNVHFECVPRIYVRRLAAFYLLCTINVVNEQYKSIRHKGG